MSHAAVPEPPPTDPSPPGPGADPGAPRVGPARVLALLCLAAPVVALLWVGSYTRREPELLGFPFFFWYQLVWVFIASALTWVAYRIYSREDAARRARRAGGAGGPARTGEDAP